VNHFLENILRKIDPRNKSDDFRSSLKNAFYNSAEAGLLPILWIISTPIFVSSLGVERYGIWMLINGLIGFGGGALGLGLTDATIKYVSKYRALSDGEKVNEVIRCTVSIYLLMGLVMAVIVFYSAPFLVNNVFNIEQENKELAVIAIGLGALGIISRFINDIFRSVIYAFERHDINARVTMIIDSVTIGFNVLLVMLGYGLVEVLLTIIFFLAIGGFIKAWIIKTNLSENLIFLPLFKLTIVKEVFGYSYYTWLRSILHITQSNFDRFLIASLISTSMLTYYTVALKAVQAVHTLLNRSTTFLFPFISKLIAQEKSDRLLRVYNKSTAAIIVVSTSLFLPLYLFGYNILEVWMGAEFAAIAVTVMNIFTIRYALSALGISNHHFLLGSGLVKLQFYTYTISAILILAGMWFLIPVYGIAGAALGKLMSIPIMIVTRTLAEKQIFGSSNIKNTLSFLLPTLVIFLIATLFTEYFYEMSMSVFILLPSIALAAIISVFLTYSIIKSGQHLKIVTA